MRGKTVAGIAITAALCVGTAAKADQGIFAASGNGVPQDLILTVSGGATYSFDTSQGEFEGEYLNQGWWSPTGTNVPENVNIFAGLSVPDFFNDFFTFDIGGPIVNGPPVVSAILRINDVGSVGVLGAPFTYSLFDVSTDAATLNNNTGTSASIYSDLRSGNMYGSVLVTGQLTAPFDIPLNANAVSAINATFVPGALEYFSIGGTLFPSTVPEPATIALLGVGLAGLGFSRRRKPAT